MTLYASPADARYTYQMIKDDDVDETVKVDVTGGPSTLYFLDCVSSDASNVLYVKFYDATIVTPGTTRPVLAVEVATQASKRLSFPDGIPFTTAVSYSCTTAAGTGASDSTGAGTNKMTIRFVVT
jgi:hypothetical protein